MSEIALSRNAVRKSSGLSHTSFWVVFGAWFGIVFLLAANDLFVAAPGAAPVTLLTAATAPIVLFLFLVYASPSVRDFALSVDLKLTTAVQAWRIGGYTFLILYAYGYLPGYFAWPAGLGDMFIGATAPLMVAKVLDARFTRSRTFIAWHVFGILDLVVAVTMGGLGSFLFGNSASVSPTAIMSQMPLVLVPTFFVPTFVVLHLVALLQARRS